MGYIERNAKTVAVRAIQAGNHSLLEKLLETRLVDPSSSLVIIKPESQSMSSRLVCSTISPTGLQPEVCKCGLDVVICRDYLQRAGFLELAAFCGQVRMSSFKINFIDFSRTPDIACVGFGLTNPGSHFFSDQWPIQDSPRREGASNPLVRDKNSLFEKGFAENCMKMKEIGRGVPGAPLDLPMLTAIH